MRLPAALILGLMMPALCEAAVIVRFHREARPEGTLVRLGEIAEIAAETEVEQTRLAGLSLAPVPASGRSQRLTLAEIRHRLLALGVDLSDVEFSGSSSVLVYGTDLPAAETPTPNAPRPAPRAIVTDSSLRRLQERLARDLAADLARKAPELGPCEVSLELTTGQAETLAAAHEVPVDALAGTTIAQVGTWNGGTPPWTGSQALRLHVTTREGRVTEIPVSATITPWRRVVVVRNHVTKGHILTSADVATKTVPPRTSGADDLVDPRTVIGRQVTRTVREGEVLTAELIREVPLVRRGETVTVTARRGGIAVRTEARASEDGTLGQTIPLVSRDGKQRLMGRVVAFHEVETVAATGDTGGVKLIQAAAAQTDTAQPATAQSATTPPATIPTANSTSGPAGSR